MCPAATKISCALWCRSCSAASCFTVSMRARRCAKILAYPSRWRAPNAARPWHAARERDSLDALLAGLIQQHPTAWAASSVRTPVAAEQGDAHGTTTGHAAGDGRADAFGGADTRAPFLRHVRSGPPDRS